MSFHTILILLFSALTLALAQPQQCSGLVDYQPAQVYCAIKYPVAVPTITNTITKTMTPKANPTSPGALNTTSQGYGGKSTRTMTAVVTKTVTDCGHIPFPTCLPELSLPIEWPSILDGKLAKLGPRAMEERAYQGLEQRSELSEALAWFKILTSGDMAARSLCSCIQPRPSQTATAIQTVTATARL